MENLVIRTLKKEDASEIDRINEVITKNPAKDEFKRMVEELEQNPGNKSYVAEYQGKVVGYMISYVLSAGFGIGKSAWIATVGGKKQIHVIDQDKCTNCGTCFEVCPSRFSAVTRLSGEPVPPPIPEDERTIVRESKEK